MHQNIPCPREFYSVAFVGIPSLDSLLSLSSLYLPLIGKDTFALYMTLLSQSMAKNSEQIISHDTLFQAISLNGALFCKARERLEGVALLQTFVKDSYEFGKEYFYRLKMPLSFSQFFAEPLFSGMLLDRVGQRAFDSLVEDYQRFSVEVSGMENVSKKFMEVYAFDLNVLNEEDECLHKARQKTALDVPAVNFDVEFFKQMMKKQDLSFSSEKQDIERLKSLCSLFGFTEVELFNEAKNVARAGTVLDISKLNEYLKEKELKISRKKMENSEESLQQNLFSAVELKVIEEARSLFSMDYLKNIRQQKGGMVTKNELDLLADLEKELTRRNQKFGSKIKIEILNVLINYILVIQRHSSLPRNYALTILDDWMQKGVVDASSAVLHLREMVENQKVRKEKKYDNSRNFGKKVEKIPEWMKEVPKREKKEKNQTTVSQEEVEQLRKELAEFSNFSKRE
ncbi:MAG: hypothetical protein LBT69_05350 [Lactobacillales bacterium]|jgi:replication initiation and membrane attachment protein|nr:hypothetical protein [Lactobacillales bacterium]